MTQHEYNTTQLEYKGSLGSKKRGLIRTFCYFIIYFLISFWNGKYSPTRYFVFNVWIPVVYKSFRNATKQPWRYEILRTVEQLISDTKLKIVIQVPKTYVPPLSCFLKNHYRFWKLTLSKRGVYILKRIRKSFFPCLDSTFNIYSSYSVVLQICSIFTKNIHAEVWFQ